MARCCMPPPPAASATNDAPAKHAASRLARSLRSSACTRHSSSTSLVSIGAPPVRGTTTRILPDQHFPDPPHPDHVLGGGDDVAADLLERLVVQDVALGRRRD